MKAKKKPLSKKTLAEFGVTTDRRLKILKVTGMSSSPLPNPSLSSGQSVFHGSYADSCFVFLQNRHHDRAVARLRMLVALCRSSRSWVLSKGLRRLHRSDISSRARLCPEFCTAPSISISRTWTAVLVTTRCVVVLSISPIGFAVHCSPLRVRNHDVVLSRSNGKQVMNSWRDRKAGLRERRL